MKIKIQREMKMMMMMMIVIIFFYLSIIVYANDASLRRRLKSVEVSATGAPLAVIDPVFLGLECHELSVYPAPECPRKSMCCCQSTCVIWKCGELFNLLPSTTSTATNPSTSTPMAKPIEGAIAHLPPPCHVPDLLKLNASFHNEIWTYPKHCSMTRYNSTETDVLLRGHSLVFYGDSLVRQLFLRLVWHLRGFGEIIEHYFHAHAMYVRNATHDYFYVGVRDDVGFHRFALDKKGSDFIVNPTMEIVLIFDPRLENADGVISLFNRHKKEYAIPIVVGGIHYWSKVNETLPHIPKQIQRIQRFTSRNGKFIWYPTPNVLFTRRNQYYEGFVDTNKSAWILPSEAMSIISPFLLNTQDMIHYQCGFMSRYQEQVQLQYKAPKTGDCRDMFNFNLMQIILNIIVFDDKSRSHISKLNKLQKVKPLFVGKVCYPQSVYLDADCPRESMCTEDSTCVVWQEGELYHLLPSHASTAATSSVAKPIGTAIAHLPPPCHVPDLLKLNASFHNEIWTYPKHCSMTRYNSTETDVLLRGHSLVFYGDSLVRQLFLRLVWHLRGFGEIIEQPFNAHAMYVRNATHDYFYVGRPDDYAKIHWDLEKKGSDFIINPTMEIVFLFDPKFDDPDVAVSIHNRQKRAYAVPMIVAGIHYWIGPQDLRPDIASKILRFQQAVGHGRFIWYPTPNGQLWQRNRYFESYVDLSKAWILPSEGMANKTQYLPNVVNGTDYQCSMNNGFFQTIQVDNYKAPVSNDCRDMFNLNLIYIMLNIILHEEKLWWKAHSSPTHTSSSS